MHNDNDYWNTANREREEKLRHRSFWERNRWMIIIISSLVVLVVIFASTTFLLLTGRQKSVSASATSAAPTPTAQIAAPTPTSTVATPTPEPTGTPTPGLNATVTTSQPSASSITTSTKNYQFICITNCDDKFDVLLNTITINLTNKTMSWNFTITDNGPVCSGMRGSLQLESPAGNQIQADSGTFLDDIAVNANQVLPRTADFSSAPTQGVQYTATLSMRCDSTYNTATYQSTVFSY